MRSSGCGRCPAVTIYGESDLHGAATIGSASSPSTSGRCPTRWWPRFSATRRGSACGAAASARSRTSRSSWGARAGAAALAPRTPCGDRSRQPGMVRISLGVYNTATTSTPWSRWCERIARDDYRGEYCQVPESGDYRAAGEDQLANTEFHAPVRSSARASAPHFETADLRACYSRAGRGWDLPVDVHDFARERERTATRSRSARSSVSRNAT